MDKDKFVDEIADLIVNTPEKVVFWVGAGLSFKTYGSFWTSISDLTNKAEKKYQGPYDVVDTHQNFSDEGEWKAGLEKVFKLTDERKINIDPSYLLITQIVKNRPIHVVSTNFDIILQHKLDLNDNQVQFFPELKNNSGRKISYIHGRYDFPNSVLFGGNRLKDAYSKNNFKEFFKDSIFQEKNVVFLGTSFQDPVVERMIQKIHSELWDDAVKERGITPISNSYWCIHQIKKSQINEVEFNTAKRLRDFRFVSTYCETELFLRELTVRLQGPILLDKNQDVPS